MNILLNAYEYWQYENKNKQAFKEIDEFEDFKETSRYRRSVKDKSVSVKKNDGKKTFKSYVKEWGELMQSPMYELVVNIVGIVNILMVVIRTIDISESTNYITIWIYL